MKRRTLVLGGVSAGIGLPFAASAARVGSWPDHEIKVILPVSAGGANDLLARSVFDYVGKSLNTTFVILNSPGGGAVRGTILLAKSKPDGYTVGNVSYSGLLLTPHTVEVSYTLSDFDMLGSAGEPLYGVAVNSNSPVETMADLVALAKKRPVTVSSNTIVNMVCMFQLATKTGASFQWIPTRTETEAVMLAGGGEVDCVVQSAPEITSGVATGRLKMIASANSVRWPSKPEIKTIMEQGYDVANSVPLGYGAPAGLDPAIRLALQDEIVHAAGSPEIKETMRRIGIVSRPLNGEGLAESFRKAAPIMDKVMSDAGLKKY